MYMSDSNHLDEWEELASSKRLINPPSQFLRLESRCCLCAVCLLSFPISNIARCTIHVHIHTQLNLPNEMKLENAQSRAEYQQLISGVSHWIHTGLKMST